MMDRNVLAIGALAALGASQAWGLDVIGGQTSVLLDTALLNSAAGLDLSGVSSDVIAPGNLGAGSVAFAINTRDASSLPTTFAYTPGLASFSGAIEHTGSVFFNVGTVEVGNFTIGFDQVRADAGLSGFFVESTTGIAAILFDIAPVVEQADAGGLRISGDLLVSSEFATFLGNNALTGVDVGDALVEAVPAPGAATLFALGAAAAGRRRR